MGGRMNAQPCFMRYEIPRLIKNRSCIRCGAPLYIDSPTDDCGHCATCWEFHHDCRCPKAA